MYPTRRCGVYSQRLFPFVVFCWLVAGREGDRRRCPVDVQAAAHWADFQYPTSVARLSLHEHCAKNFDSPQRIDELVRSVAPVSSRTSEACSRSFEPNSSTSFRLTGGQGAALLTKHPTYREDVKLGRKFEEYTKEHYDSWVGFAREHGHPKDIKPVLVTGVDMTRDFAMMSYSNDDDDDLEARFTTSAPGAPSPWGAWDTPGVVHTNCGPQPLRPPPTTQTADPAPSGSSHIETVSDEYHQCVFVRYYTVRKRLGIPRVIKAAAGPHDLGPGGSHDGGSPLEMEYSSDSGSDIAQILFDDDGDNDNSSVTSIGSEPETVVHNTTPVRYLHTFLPFRPS